MKNLNCGIGNFKWGLKKVNIRPLKAGGKYEPVYIHKEPDLEINGNQMPGFLALLGIVRVELTSPYDLEALYFLSDQLVTYLPLKWKFLKIDEVLVILKGFFAKCHKIEFRCLSDLIGAEELWIGIIQDVVKPLRKIKLTFSIPVNCPNSTLRFGKLEHVLAFLSCGAVLVKCRGKGDKISIYWDCSI